MGSTASCAASVTRSQPSGMPPSQRHALRFGNSPKRGRAKGMRRISPATAAAESCRPTSKTHSGSQRNIRSSAANRPSSSTRLRPMSSSAPQQANISPARVSDGSKRPSHRYPSARGNPIRAASLGRGRCRYAPGQTIPTSQATAQPMAKTAARFMPDTARRCESDARRTRSRSLGLMAKRSPVTSPNAIPAAEAFSPPAPASTASRSRTLQASTCDKGASDSTRTFLAPMVKVRRNTPRVRQRQPQSVVPGLSNPPVACGRAARATWLPGVGREAGSCHVQTIAPGSGISCPAAVLPTCDALAPSGDFFAWDFTGAAPGWGLSPSSNRNTGSDRTISRRLPGFSSTEEAVPNSTPLGRWSIHSGRSGTAGRRAKA